MLILAIFLCATPFALFIIGALRLSGRADDAGEDAGHDHLHEITNARRAARLRAAIARQDAERGRPLTPREKLANLKRFLAEPDASTPPELVEREGL